MKTAAKESRKVLAGIEPVLKSDFGDGLRRVFLKLAGGSFQSALVEIFHCAGVYQVVAMLAEGGDAHAALRRHFLQRPWLATVRAIRGQIVGK